MRSKLPRLTARLCAVALLLWPGIPPARGTKPTAAAEPAPGWQAVLVAADNAQPVFDNGVEAIARQLAARGVPAGNIHRLSASAEPRDAGVEPSSAERLLGGIAGLPLRRGERCLVFITSHGKQDAGVWLARDRDYLQPDALARALSGACARMPTVVVVSACFSGIFAAAPMRAPNRIILTAARRDRPSFGCQTDRTYTFFDECLIEALPRATTWRGAFSDTVACVGRMERRLKALPSEPQAYFGRAVRDLPTP
jgi:hypothetical protein